MSRQGTAYVDLDRASWAELAGRWQLTVSEQDLAGLRALGEPVGLAEVQEVYLPLARLLLLQTEARSRLREATSAFLAQPIRPAPFVLGIVGKCGVGQVDGCTSAARAARPLEVRAPGGPGADRRILAAER